MRAGWSGSRAPPRRGTRPPTAPSTLLVTNATLQWVPTHLRLLPRWLEALAPGGVLAMQVPANFDAPSHRLMREVARRHPRADDLRAGLDRADAVARPETYAALLLAQTREVDVWQTTYLQVLTAEADAPHPVLEWVRSTGLRPVLGVLTDARGARSVPRHLRERARGGIPPPRRGRALPLHADLRRGTDAALSCAPNRLRGAADRGIRERKSSSGCHESGGTPSYP